MGCCHQRHDFKDSRRKSKNPDTFDLTSYNSRTCLLLLKQKQDLQDWKWISQYINSTEAIPSNLLEDLKPTPSCLGCLAIIILTDHLKSSVPDHKTLFCGILPTLIQYLSSPDRSLRIHSYNLIHNFGDSIPESSIYHIARLGIFERLLNIREKNTVMLSFKLYANRESVQRLFLKNNGVGVICMNLILFRDQTDLILPAILNLLFDSEGKMNLHNSKLVFSSDILKILGKEKNQVSEVLFMAYEEYLAYYNNAILT